MKYSVFSAEQAESGRLDESWGSLRWLAGRRVGNADGLTLGRVVIKAGESNPPHRHPNCEEALYLMKGRLRHFIGAEEVILEAGDTLVVGAGLSHHALNIGTEDADMIVAYSAGERGFEPTG